MLVHKKPLVQKADSKAKSNVNTLGTNSFGKSPIILEISELQIHTETGRRT